MFQQIKATEEEHTRCIMDSCNSDMAVDDDYNSLIQQPHVVELALLETCCMLDTFHVHWMIPSALERCSSSRVSDIFFIFKIFFASIKMGLGINISKLLMLFVSKSFWLFFYLSP